MMAVACYATSMNIPDPVCKLGYPETQLEEILGARLKDFNVWMRGQTVSLCDGKYWDYEEMEYKPSGCGPHGAVVYSCDVQDFLEGRDVQD